MRTIILLDAIPNSANSSDVTIYDLILLLHFTPCTVINQSKKYNEDMNQTKVGLQILATNTIRQTKSAVLV